MTTPLFRSFFMGGFECSTPRLPAGRRLDLIAATAHDRHALADYLRLRGEGLRVARDGLRWHLIERRPGRYDFASALPLVRAARATGVQVIWDLCHYGWPDHLDIFAPNFVGRFARFARAFARLLAGETDVINFISPVNEISFFSWAAADAGWFYPCAQGRAGELKRQLVRAGIEAVEAMWEVDPRTRVVHTDPVIKVIARPDRPEEAAAAEQYRLSQYEAWDMLAGRAAPELGGQEKYLDILGLNYYVHNQWFYPDRTMIPRSHPLYTPFRQLLAEVYGRYRRPLFVAETGIEDEERPGWLRYIGQEVRAALVAGVPVEGICLYPILNHPGWVDDRHCHNGLWDYADENGRRQIYRPLADEIAGQSRAFDELLSPAGGGRERPSVRCQTISSETDGTAFA
jgi:beta-glucosidase/6-phospho-beta-glucosidase/beta-galactosidase